MPKPLYFYGGLYLFCNTLIAIIAICWYSNEGEILFFKAVFFRNIKRFTGRKRNQ